ncbi:Mitogen-activated protein kinase kinase 2 [Diplonema papillatum]|nr:Mitogen-activated protein kinase kinase 2 [Diplonema papillatum]|eukprot:gene10219-15713_t
MVEKARRRKWAVSVSMEKGDPPAGCVVPEPAVHGIGISQLAAASPTATHASSPAESSSQWLSQHVSGVGCVEEKVPYSSTDFNIIRVLGKGAQGRVSLVEKMCDGSCQACLSPSLRFTKADTITPTSCATCESEPDAAGCVSQGLTETDASVIAPGFDPRPNPGPLTSHTALHTAPSESATPNGNEQQQQQQPPPQLPFDCLLSPTRAAPAADAAPQGARPARAAKREDQQPEHASGKKRHLFARKEVLLHNVVSENLALDMKRLSTEIEILKVTAQRCSNLVRSFASYYCESTREIHILMEYLDCGSLHDVLREQEGQHLGENETCIAAVAVQILEGLRELHQGGGDKMYMHRDLKPENILLSWDGHCKIGDFGVAKHITTAASMQSHVGNFAYMAPERLAPGSMSPCYGTPSDLWSVGLLVFTMFCSTYPIRFTTQFQLVKLLTSFNWDAPPASGAWSKPLHASPAASAFLASALQADPGLRPSAQALLSHGFVKQHAGAPGFPRACVAQFLEKSCQRLAANAGD